jgi:hypothetical protein
LIIRRPKKSHAIIKISPEDDMSNAASFLIVCFSVIGKRVDCEVVGASEGFQNMFGLIV